MDLHLAPFLTSRVRRDRSGSQDRYARRHERASPQPRRGSRQAHEMTRTFTFCKTAFFSSRFVLDVPRDVRTSPGPVSDLSASAAIAPAHWCFRAPIGQSLAFRPATWKCPTGSRVKNINAEIHLSRQGHWLLQIYPSGWTSWFSRNVCLSAFVKGP